MRDSPETPASEPAPEAATSVVVIVDDHPLMRDALALAAARAAPSARVRAFAAATAALQAEPEPDLVLLDLDLGEGGDLSNVLRWVRCVPGARVAIVSATERVDVMRRARALGASGYICKSASLTEMCSAIAALLSGREVFPEGAAGEPDAAVDRAAEGLGALTPTQAKVLSGLREGRLNKQIAHDLSISEATVKAHMTAIFRKLGVHNRAQAILAAQALDVRP